MILITIIRIIDNNHFSGELYIPVTVEIYIYIYLNKFLHSSSSIYSSWLTES